MKRLLIIGILVCVLFIGAASALLSGYGYYQDVTINNTGSNLTNYQMIFTVNTSNGTSSGTTIYLNSHSESDLDDLRFTSTSDTVYDYWIESLSNPYTVYVKVPSIPAGNSTMRVQYGNAAASAYTNGTNTFLFFEDCTNISDWNVISGTWGTTTISNISRIYCQNGDNKYLNHSSYRPPYNGNHILEYTLRFSADSNYGGGVIYPYVEGENNELTFKQFTSFNQFSIYWRGSEYKQTVSTSGGVDYNFKVVYTQTNIKTYVGGTLKHNQAITAPTGYLAAGYVNGDTFHLISGLTSGYVYWANIRFREYAATEPTGAAWSSESPTSASPAAAFSGNVTSGAAPLTVAFTDSSSNTPTSWAWSFDDGEANSTQQNPTRTFNAAGVYSITLTATNDDGSDTEEKVDYITVCDVPAAAFSGNVTSGAAPLAVAFTDSSTNTPTSWAWSFDDGGANSTQQNPIRTFNSSGVYTITLTATNCGGSDTETKVDYIVAATLSVFPGCSSVPTDIDADGYFEDVNGNSRLDYSDLILFFTYLEWAKTNEPASLFNFANDGGTLTYADVIALFQEL